MWPWQSKESSSNPTPELQKPLVGSENKAEITHKFGDLRIRQTNVDRFWVEEYVANKAYYGKCYQYWKHILIGKNSGHDFSVDYYGSNLQYDYTYETLSEAQDALRRRQQVIETERFRKDNYVNVYYPESFERQPYVSDTE